MKNRTRVLFLATALVALAVCGGVAFAQPGPTPTPAPSPLSTMTMAVLIINIVVGFTLLSDSEIAGNSTGNPPACNTPRFTSSTRVLKCA